MEKKTLSGPIPFPLLEVVWDDAETSNGWENPKTPEPSLALSLGFLVAESDKHIILASTICKGDNNTNCRIQIPKAMVIRKKVIQNKAR